jgi:hypothetical protein
MVILAVGVRVEGEILQSGPSPQRGFRIHSSIHANDNMYASHVLGLLGAEAMERDRVP